MFRQTRAKRMRRPGGGKKNRGAALIIAVMIVALVTVLSVEIYWHFNLALSRSGSRMFGVQARAYLDAVEDFARTVLKADMEENQVDTLEEIWAIDQPPFPTDDGYVGGRIEDAQGRFNINQLQTAAAKNPNGGFFTDWSKRYTAPQRRFIRLLQTFEYGEGEVMDQPTAESITDAVIDWLDPDSEVSGFGGAEGDFYSRLEPPMTIGNDVMVSVSELSLVKGVTPELYESLLPYIIALPVDVGLNINTMRPELLRILNNSNDPMPLDMEDAQLLLESRGMAGYSSVQEFLDFPDVEALFDTQNVGNRQGGGNNQSNPNAFDSANLTVSSDYFLFFGEAMVAEHIMRSQSMLMRTDQGVVTIRRTDANF